MENNAEILDEESDETRLINAVIITTRSLSAYDMIMAKLYDIGRLYISKITIAFVFAMYQIQASFVGFYVYFTYSSYYF